MRVKFLIAIAIWSLLGASAVCRVQSASAPPLALTTELVSRRYCTGSANMDVIQMRLRLRYANTGRQKLILYKGDSLFYQTRIRRAPEDATAKPYEVAILNARYFDERPENLDTPSPNKYFTVLSPGAVYETEIVVSVGIAGEGSQRGSNAVNEGEHTLELTVSSWYKSKNLAETLRRRWQRSGLLLIDPVTSAPLKFTVERQRRTLSCQ